MRFDEVVEKRHSVKEFKRTKKPNWRDIVEAVDVANRAPSAGNISSVKFILVDDARKIEKIGEASQQDHVSDVSYIVVVCSDCDKCIKSYGKAEGEKYCRQQAGAAIENFLLKIADMKLGACWVGAFGEQQVKTALRIPDNIVIEAIIPVGYEMGSKKQEKKANLDDVLFFNEWKNKNMKRVSKPEA